MLIDMHALEVCLGEETVIARQKETPEQRALRCRLAAKTRWTRTSAEDRAEQMAQVRAGISARFRQELDPENRFSEAEIPARLKDFQELEALRAKYQSAKRAPTTARGSKAARPSGATDDLASGTESGALKTEQESR